MHRIGFDSDQYVEMQSRHIAQRRSEFGGKLYLEFGGKLIDDMHASRVLPGFTPDNKVRMLRELADEVEIIVAALLSSVHWVMTTEPTNRPRSRNSSI